MSILLNLLQFLGFLRLFGSKVAKISELPLLSILVTQPLEIPGGFLKESYFTEQSLFCAYRIKLSKSSVSKMKNPQKMSRLRLLSAVIRVTIGFILKPLIDVSYSQQPTKMQN